MKTFLMKMCSLLLFTTTGCCCNSTPAVVMEKNALLIDVRTPEEFRSGAIPDALNMPHDRIGETIASAAPDKKTPLYLYCRSGRRVGVAMATLKEQGYSVMHNLGGIEEARKKLALPEKK